MVYLKVIFLVCNCSSKATNSTGEEQWRNSFCCYFLFLLLMKRCLSTLHRPTFTQAYTVLAFTLAFVTFFKLYINSIFNSKSTDFWCILVRIDTEMSNLKLCVQSQLCSSSVKVCLNNDYSSRGAVSTTELLAFLWLPTLNTSLQSWTTFVKLD